MKLPMKKWFFLLILILPQLLKAGTTVIHVETEGWGTIQHADADTAVNTKGAMFWNGTKWVTNETAAHMFFTDIRTGKRLKEYNIINVELNLLWRWVWHLHCQCNLYVFIFRTSFLKIKDMKKNKIRHLMPS
jgi:hypothetical protein